LMEPDRESVYLTPGGSHQVVFWLKNTGNFDDLFNLDISVDQVHLDNGWKFGFGSGTGQPSVHQGQISNVIIMVTVPLDSPRFYSVILRINVTSSKTGYTTTSAPGFIFTDILYGGDIESIEEPMTLEPGEDNIVSFNFTNTGNDRDSYQDLRVTYRPSEWVVYIDESLFSEGIGPMTTVSVEMHVFVPMTYPATEAPDFPKIIVEARGGPSDILLDTETFLFSIPERHALVIECEDNRTIGSPGETVKLNISVTNMGNCNDTFSITSDELELELLPDLSGNEIEPGGTIDAVITFQVPVNLCADSDPSTLWPDSEGLYDPYIIHIDGRSMNETLPDETKVSLPIMMYILPVFAIEAETMGGPIKKLPFDHDQARTFQVNVTNMGNVGCNVSASLLNAPPWLSVPIGPRYIPYDGDMSFQVLLDYNAFDMDNGDVENVTIRLFIDRNMSEPLIHDLSIGFHFLPYSFHIVSLDISPMSLLVDERYVLEHGANHTFTLLVHREGEDLLLPETMDGPFMALYIDDNDICIGNVSIPLMAPGNETWVELGPIEIYFTGVHTLEFRIEGMGADSVQGGSSVKIDVYVEPLDEEKDDDTGSAALWTAIIIVSLLIITALLLITAARKKINAGEKEPEE
ncbi:MAG: hypothetical protein JW939_00075, partial [Candidatus Thermoplasmatota archaeon]|nr:hypothetical protein [Candidatus Thermoplasmatota archaeon]